MKRKRQWLPSLSVFLFVSILMVVHILPAHGLRRIQNDPYQPWDLNNQEYEYLDLEDQDVIQVPPSVPPPQQRPLYPNRPPSRNRNFNTGLRPVPFGGQFHISRDRFLPFVASDVIMEQPGIASPKQVLQPKPKAIVPSTNSAYSPEITSEPSYIYYTPSTSQITTRSPIVGPKPETFVERKRQRFYSNNETETFVVPARPPEELSRDIKQDSFDAGWKKTTDFNLLNRLSATSAQPPGTEYPHELTTSQVLDIQRTFKPNTIYPYPTDRVRSGSEYRRSNPIIQQNSINNLSSEGDSTERAIVTSGEPVTEHPYQEKEQQRRRLSSGAIAGIAIGILAPLALVAGAVAYLFYGRHFKTAALKGIDESYIDDSIRPSGFMNSHIELPKESSEEMTSLDNDSFLNSLEAVTIQNYWAESAKNTKV